MHPVLYASTFYPTHQYNRKMKCHANFVHIELPRRINAWCRYGSISAKCLSQEHNNPLSSSGAQPKVYNLAVAKLRFYPLSCNGAVVGIFVLSVFTKDILTARKVKGEHQTSKLTFIIRRSKKLSYTAA